MNSRVPTPLILRLDQRTSRVFANAIVGILALAGLVATWVSRNAMNPDGVSYLNVSDVYLAGDWPASHTGYWSPLYPTLIAVARLIGGTATARAPLMAHIVNLVAYLAGLYFVRRIVDEHRAVAAGPALSISSSAVWSVLLYGSFGWATLGAIGISLITPDMCVGALVLGAWLAVMKIQREPSTHVSWIVLGLLLGAAYLTKTALLPIALVMMFLTRISLRGRRVGLVGPALGAATLAAVCAPQVLYVSDLKGSATIGDVGRLNYGWFVAKTPPPEYPGSAFALPAEMPRPDRPSGPLASASSDSSVHPILYIADGPVPGTFPPWYDPTYWYRNVTFPISIWRNGIALLFYAARDAVLLAPFLLAGLLFSLPGGITGRALSRMKPNEVPVLTAVVAMTMYGLVYSEARYIAPFAIMALGALVPPNAQDHLSSRLRAGFAIAALLLCARSLASVALEVPESLSGEHKKPLAVANELNGRGVRCASKVALVGDPYGAYWAYHGRLRIVASIPHQDVGAFWSLTTEKRAKLLDRMADAGASAVMAEIRPNASIAPQWSRLSADSSIVFRLLNAERAASEQGQVSQTYPVLIGLRPCTSLVR